MSIVPSGTGIDATCKCLSRFGLQVSFADLLASSQLHRSRLNRTNEQPNNLKTWTPFGTAACVGCACFTITAGGPGPRLIEGERCAVYVRCGLSVVCGDACVPEFGYGPLARVSGHGGVGFEVVCELSRFVCLSRVSGSPLFFGTVSLNPIPNCTQFNHRSPISTRAGRSTGCPSVTREGVPLVGLDELLRLG